MLRLNFDQVKYLTFVNYRLETLSKEMKKNEELAKENEEAGNTEAVFMFEEKNRKLQEEYDMYNKGESAIDSYIYCIGNAEGEIPYGSWKRMYDSAVPDVYDALKLMENEFDIKFKRKFKKLKSDIKHRNSLIEKEKLEKKNTDTNIKYFPDPVKEAKLLMRLNDKPEEEI